MHNPLKFGGPLVILSVKLTHRQLTDGFKFVGVAVGDRVAFQVIIFELSVKCRRTKSVGVAVGDVVAFQIIISCHKIYHP